eukprot:6184418-Pleurochrysis_carterae.AAC.4
MLLACNSQFAEEDQEVDVQDEGLAQHCFEVCQLKEVTVLPHKLTEVGSCAFFTHFAPISFQDFAFFFALPISLKRGQIGEQTCIFKLVSLGTSRRWTGSLYTLMISQRLNQMKLRTSCLCTASSSLEYLMTW